MSIHKVVQMSSTIIQKMYIYSSEVYHSTVESTNDYFWYFMYIFVAFLLNFDLRSFECTTLI